MYLVFDVGGTFVKYAWMNVDGNIQEKGKYPTPTREGESVPEFVESLGQIYDRYKDHYNQTRTGDSQPPVTRYEQQRDSCPALYIAPYRRFSSPSANAEDRL